MDKTRESLASGGGERGASAHDSTGVKVDGRRYSPLIELTLIRMREFLREKEAVFWVFIFPVLLACALGIAFRNTAPERVRVAVIGAEGAPPELPSRVAGALSRSPDVEAVVLSREESARAMRGGAVSLVVRARQGAGPGAGASPEPDSLLPRAIAFDYVLDPTRPESRLARLAVDRALAEASGQSDAVGAREEEVTEPGARYIDFLIPGLIGLNLMGSGMWGLGFNIVMARGRKLLKRFAATPMRRSDYLLSFMLSRLVFLLLEVGAVLGFARLAFGVNVHGSLLSVFAIALVGALTFAGIGLLVAARPTTIEGVSGLMNLVMLPMWLLSGTFFSSERFPALLQPFIRALPLTAVNHALRSVINEGGTLWGNWAQLLVLAAWCVVSFIIALRIFRWQ